MCGIAGWLDRYEDLSDKGLIINRMSKTLERRGPDQGGVFLEKEQGVCLIHRRLTVIDPKGGTQPMTAKNSVGAYTIVYNGELYNTEDIRKELLAAGYTFEGHSDTEVVLKSYMHWGNKCPEKLNGIFAFAIWNSSKNSLFLVRDRIGVKPLFYFDYKGGLIFGSEIKTLLANPRVRPVIDKQGLYELFFMAPGRTGGQAVFKNIKELKPGQYAEYKNGALRIQTYFSLKAKEHEDDEKTTIEKTRWLLEDSITRQLVSDVPLCTFLSGGLDSSIISNTAAKYFKETGRGKLTTFSVDYEDNKKFFQKSAFQPNTDSDYIGLMVDHIGSDHKEVVLSNEKLYEALIPANFARDLPGMADVDSSFLLFCEDVKKEFTVALSGECADELFGGYPWYHNKDILFEECFPWSRNLSVRRSILKDGLLPDGEDYVHEKYLQAVKATDKLPGESKLEGRMKEMFNLNFYWFMQTLLDRSNRMSMYNSLEVRVPFCDYRIVEYAYNMPWNLKALDGREKGILRTAMSDVLPHDIVWRKKSPYPKTHNPVYMKLVSDGVKAIMADKRNIINEFIDEKGVMEIIEKPDSITAPWYGQLMKAPQILAYIIQLNNWFNEYKVEIAGCE